MKLQKSDILKISSVLVIFITGLIAGYQILKPQRSLPIYNPADLDDRLVDESIQRKGKDHKVMDFSLSDQYGDTLTLEDLRGKIFVADFFFTTCPGICKDMAIQKRRLQEALKNDTNFVIVSHSVTPEIDSVPVMKEYADLQGAIRGKWYLLTGDKPQIYNLARKSYFAILDEGGNGDENDFIHTENFILVDTKRRIRGFYDGTSAEDTDRLIKDIKLLESETFK